MWGKENPQQNQPASSDNSQQDLTTGFAVDNVADNAAKVMISKQSAKHELDKLVHKYVGQRKTRGFVGDLAAALGNRDSRPRQTYYFDFRDNEGKEYTLRISNHNVNGENAAKDEREISIVIKSRRQPNKFVQGEADIKEYVYFKDCMGGFYCKCFFSVWICNFFCKCLGVLVWRWWGIANPAQVGEFKITLRRFLILNYILSDKCRRTYMCQNLTILLQSIANFFCNIINSGVIVLRAVTLLPSISATIPACEGNFLLGNASTSVVTCCSETICIFLISPTFNKAYP